MGGGWPGARAPHLRWVGWLPPGGTTTMVVYLFSRNGVQLSQTHEAQQCPNPPIYIYTESISTCTVLVPTVPYQYCIRIQCILVLPQNWHLRGLTHSTEWHSQLKCQLYVYWNSDWWSGVRNGKSDMADDLSWISTRIHCIPVGSHEPFGESRADSRVQRLDFPRVL